MRKIAFAKIIFMKAKCDVKKKEKQVFFTSSYK